jgi:hypothetical protein
VISWEKNEKIKEMVILKKKNGCFFCRGRIPLDDAPSRYIKKILPVLYIT